MQTWWTMITTATLGHHTVLWSSLSIFWRDTQVYWSPRPARAKKIDIPIDGRHVVAMPTWQLRIPCKLRGVFRISGRCCRTSTTANWAGTCIRHIAKWLIIPTQLTLIASVCTHTIWPFSLASWGSLWLKRMLAFCCTGKSRQKVWINPLEWQPSMQWLLASRCRNRRVSPLLGFVWFDPEAGSAMALTAIRANAVHQRREEHVWNRCRMVPVNPRTDMTWTYMDIWYMYVQNCANTLEFTVTVMQICFRNHLRVRCFRGGAGRRKKCGVLVRLLHWRKTHIGNVTMQCIAMSCLSDFRTVIHSHWNCRANEHCYWNWLETWKGRKEKKTHTRQIRVFTFFFWNQHDEHIFYNCGLETWDASPNEKKLHVDLPLLSGLKPWFRAQSPFVRYRNSPLVPLPSLTHVAWQQSVAVAWQYCAKEVFSFSIVASEASIKQQAAMVWAWFELQRKYVLFGFMCRGFACCAGFPLLSTARKQKQQHRNRFWRWFEWPDTPDETPKIDLSNTI